MRAIGNEQAFVNLHTLENQGRFDGVLVGAARRSLLDDVLDAIVAQELGHRRRQRRSRPRRIDLASTDNHGQGLSLAVKTLSLHAAPE
jgi:hypothetical protein